jgi:sortase A
MTLVIDSPPEVAPGDPPLPAERRSGRAMVRAHVRRTSARVVLAALAAVAIWLICADPVAHIWYQSRQGDLRSQAASALTRLGSQTPTVGGEVAVLQDPPILNVIVAQGDNASILRGGPGHRLGTPLPGARGNSVIEGHSKDWGAPFRSLAKLTVGSTLYLQAHPGVYKLPATGDFIYTVKSVSIVPATDTRYLAPSNDYRLTLVTNADGRLSGSHVLVVTAVSGSMGKSTAVAPTGSLEPSAGSLILNIWVARLLVGAGMSAAVIAALRRRHRVRLAVLAATPVLLVTVLALFVEFDMLAFRPLA